MDYISGMPRFSLLVAVTAAAGLAACGSDSTAPRSGIAGSYKLFAVDQIRLPALTTIDGAPRTVTSGMLTVNDTSYRYIVCISATGATSTDCGAGQNALIDSGRVVSAERGPSFIGWTTHVSRALIAARDTLSFQRNDLTTPRFDFAR